MSERYPTVGEKMTNAFAVELRDIVKRFSDVTAVDHISLKVRDGEFFSLLGPSGCGKTTTLRMIAGFEMPTEGEILIGGASQGYLPPYQRPVNTVFQNYALFPHMNVEKNIAFGLEMRKVTRRETSHRVEEALDLVQLTGMGNRRPNQLSGGQQQRIALARALVNHPKVLLLDEPLGALDLKLRKAMQVELKALQHRVGITFIYVTHDQEEALTMSDRIAVMQEGRVLQVGTPEDIYEHPTSRFVADFIGETNFIPGKVQSLGPPAEIVLDNETRVTASWVEDGVRVGDRVVVSIRPERLNIAPAGEAPSSPDLARAEARVVRVIYVGMDSRYILELNETTDLVVRLPSALQSGRQFQLSEVVEVYWENTFARAFKE